MVEEGMLEDVSRERIYEEYNKILMAPHPSAGFIFLRDIHALPSYLEALVHTHQRPDYHPEGNVFNHTMLVLDLAALTKKDVSDPLAFMWSALLHDIGKPAVTTPDGHALRHYSVGAEVFDREVKIIQGKKMRIYVRTMIAYHMRLMNMARHHIRPITYKRLLKEIEGKVPVRDLMMLSRCDKLGRGAITYDTIIAFDQKMEDIMAKCGTEAPEPLVTGQDLIDANFEEKSQYRQLLEKAYDMQLAGYSKEKILRGLKNGK